MMGKRGAGKHIHKYFLNDSNLWQCALPGCLHFLPGNLSADTINGRWSICWNCRETFQLNEVLSRMEKPICADCMIKDAPTTVQSDIDWDDYIKQKTARVKKLVELRKLFPNTVIPDDVDPDEWIKNMVNRNVPGRAELDKIDEEEN